MSKKTKVDWIIHIVRDGICDCCGEIHDDSFLPGMCDAHTHGLDKYGSLELQFVLMYPDDVIGDLLNTIGKMVADGLKLRDGMFIDSVCYDEAKILVKEMKDCDGHPIFRLIMPDGLFRYPENSDEIPYNWQYKNPYKVS